MQLFPHHLLKKLYLFHCIAFAVLLKKKKFIVHNMWVYFRTLYSIPLM